MTFQTGQSISEVGNISTLYYRCLHARHKQTNKTSSFRKHRSYVRLCISLRSMQLADPQPYCSAVGCMMQPAGDGDREGLCLSPAPVQKVGRLQRCHPGGDARCQQDPFRFGHQHAKLVSSVGREREVRGANGLNAMPETSIPSAVVC